MAETAAPDWSPFATEPWNPEHPPFAWDADMTDCLFFFATVTRWTPACDDVIQQVAKMSSEKVVLFFYHLDVLENLIRHLGGTRELLSTRVDIEGAHRSLLGEDDDDDPLNYLFTNLIEEWSTPENLPRWKPRAELAELVLR